MAKTYRSARGKNVDLSQILNDNEFTRAVGNMNVNARGDILDSDNKVIQSRNSRVKNQYRKQHKTATTGDVIPTSKRHAAKISAQQEALSAQSIAEQYAGNLEEKMQQQEELVTISKPAPVAQETVEDKPVVSETVAEVPAAKGGLAAAIAKARSSKQELLKSDRQEARDSDGVKRI